MFSGEEINVTNKIASKLAAERRTLLPAEFERLLLAPRRDVLVLTHMATMAQKCFGERENSKFIFVFSSPSTTEIDITPFKLETCWDLTSHDWF